jgi:hypothetical protein
MDTKAMDSEPSHSNDQAITTIDRSTYLSEFTWGIPQYPMVCFTCQKATQTCGTRYTILTIKLHYTPADATHSHEIACQSCYTDLLLEIHQLVSKWPANVAQTNTELIQRVRQIRNKLESRSFPRSKYCVGKIKLRTCCRRMIWLNSDITDEQNVYKYLSDRVPSIDQYRLARHNVNKSVDPTQLRSIFISRKEENIGQMPLNGGYIRDIDRYNPIDFICLNCHKECKKSLCLGWPMHVSRRRHRTTKRIYLLWTVRGQFCSPGCLYTYADYRPYMFPRQTALFTKMMLIKVYKYKQSVIRAIPHWRLPIYANCPPKTNTRAPVVKDPYTETQRLRESWFVKDLKVPNRIKHKFVDEQRSLVALIDRKRFNIYMEQQNNKDPLAWYAGFVADFPQFTTQIHYLTELQHEREASKNLIHHETAADSKLSEDKKDDEDNSYKDILMDYLRARHRDRTPMSSPSSVEDLFHGMTMNASPSPLSDGTTGGTRKSVLNDTTASMDSSYAPVLMGDVDMTAVKVEKETTNGTIPNLSIKLPNGVQPSPPVLPASSPSSTPAATPTPLHNAKSQKYSASTTPKARRTVLKRAPIPGSQRTGLTPRQVVMPLMTLSDFMSSAPPVVGSVPSMGVNSGGTSKSRVSLASFFGSAPSSK